MLLFYGESAGARIFCAKCNVCKKKFAHNLQSIWHENVFGKICSKLKSNIMKKIKKKYFSIYPTPQNAIFRFQYIIFFDMGILTMGQ